MDAGPAANVPSPIQGDPAVDAAPPQVPAQLPMRAQVPSQGLQGDVPSYARADAIIPKMTRVIELDGLLFPPAAGFGSFGLAGGGVPSGSVRVRRPGSHVRCSDSVLERSWESQLMPMCVRVDAPRSSSEGFHSYQSSVPLDENGVFG